MKRRKIGPPLTGRSMPVGEAAKFIGIARQNVLKLIERGTIRAGWQDGPFGPQGGRWLILESDVISYRRVVLARRRTNRKQGA